LYKATFINKYIF